jgi:hypothetical protein
MMKHHRRANNNDCHASDVRHPMMTHHRCANNNDCRASVVLDWVDKPLMEVELFFVFSFFSRRFSRSIEDDLSVPERPPKHMQVNLLRIPAIKGSCNCSFCGSHL